MKWKDTRVTTYTRGKYTSVSVPVTAGCLALASDGLIVTAMPERCLHLHKRKW